MSEHIELPAKLLENFLRSNKSNINQYMYICIYVYMHIHVHIIYIYTCTYNKLLFFSASLTLIYAHMYNYHYIFSVFFFVLFNQYCPGRTGSHGPGAPQERAKVYAPTIENRRRTSRSV